MGLTDILKVLETRKFLCFDMETTGTDKPRYFPKEHPTKAYQRDESVPVSSVLTFSGAIIENMEVQTYFDFRMRPVEGKNFTMSDSAFEVTGLDKEEVMSWPDPADTMKNHVLPLFNKHIDKYDKNDKFWPLGHNVSFDIDFLELYFKTFVSKYGSGVYQNWMALDTMQALNWLICYGKANFTNRKLEHVCEVLGIELKAHDSLEDIKATITLAGHTSAPLRHIKNLGDAPLLTNY